MKFLTAPLLCLSMFLASCTDTRPKPMEEPYIIRNDGGGQLISAEADRFRLLNWGGEVQIRGYCASACVIFTTLPNACLHKDSRIGFHSANIDIPLLVGDVQMSRYLRNGIKDMYDRKWSKNKTVVFISAQEYVELDPQTKICD